ncbi:RNA polymerase sigma factor [Cryptosporangium minutisporangium]|uniref:RNA polymerase sigma factor n=1 Tax=Cryptosporangium minutisporangium TaxID=113569 RepID=A0ABP6STP2_9ACTN
MERLQRPREERFRALYADAYAAVLRFVQRRVHASYAEDVVADAFLVAWRRLDDAPDRADDLRAWLFGIARHCLLNLHRGQERRDALAVRLAETTLVPFSEGVDDHARVTDQRLDLAAAWRRLSAAEQEVLALTWLEDLASPQGARVLGITPTAYRLRLLRARRALRRHLDTAEASSTPIGTQL